MAVVFLLGPGMWEEAKRPASERGPMQVRRDLAKILTSRGHRVILMEDDPDRATEDLIQKFDRLLRHKITDVVLYWPPQAKMQTTYDELILLCDRRPFLKRGRGSVCGPCIIPPSRRSPRTSSGSSKPAIAAATSPPPPASA